MDIRESLNKHPKVSAAVATIIVLGALVFIYRQWTAPEEGSEVITKAYFTIDDGATRFADKATRLAPFNKDGKEAVRAYVFKFGKSPEFVGYLERLSPAVMQKMQSGKPPGTSAPGGETSPPVNIELMQEGTEVKKPGQAKWVNRRSAEGSEIINVQPPAGQSGELQMVSPSS